MDLHLKTLVFKRGAVKGHMTRFKAFLKTYEASPDIEQLQERLAKLRPLWDSFENIQTEIESLQESETNIHERMSFEAIYFDLVAHTQRIITTSDVAAYAQPLQANATLNPIPSRVIKLPKINLPTFDGSYDAWLCFHDKFKSIIHDNNEIKPVQKLQYLQSCLKGEAAQVIESLTTFAENYEVAWTSLVERFGNRRIIIQGHIRSLFDLPSITRESSLQLRSLIDNALKHLRALKALDLPTDHWDAMLLHLITSKLDKNTHKEWERSIDNTVMPVIEDLWKFLKNRCHILDRVLFGTVSQTKVKNGLQPSRPAHINKLQQNCLLEKGTCSVCKGAHTIRKCNKFLLSDYSTRVSAVRDARLCFICLRSYHMSTSCKVRPCIICNRPHHRLLHPPYRRRMRR